MKNLVIVGAGPRGLAMALRALQYKDQYKIFLVDHNPISTWKMPYMISDMQMRSPISFDLTTYQEDLFKYSLTKFLRYDTKFTASQKEIEECDIYCSRKDFVNYLKYILTILQKNEVVCCPHKVLDVTEDFVMLSDCTTMIEYDALVFATGRYTQEAIIPNYVRGTNLKTIPDLYGHIWKDKYCNVVGSGQNAAEISYYLATQGAKVTWIQKHTPKVEQYPVPSWKELGIASALGPYYTYHYVDKNEYLAKVKAWAPSITPYIDGKLKELKRPVEILQPRQMSELHINADFFLAAGYKQDVTLLPTSLDIEVDSNAPTYPRILQDFQSTSHPNIYFTGLIAGRHDGPRQGSIISAAETAKTIINSIL